MRCRPGASLAFTASTTPAAISSCTAKTSPASRSNRSDQSWKPLATSVSCAVTRSRLPAVRTLPSRRWLTERTRAISATSLPSALARKADVREATRMPVDADERVHDLLGHALAEVVLVLAGAHVRERQHRDRHRSARRIGGGCGHGPVGVGSRAPPCAVPPSGARPVAVRAISRGVRGRTGRSHRRTPAARAAWRERPPPRRAGHGRRPERWSSRGRLARWP